MDTLTEMVEALSRSESRVTAIEYAKNAGLISNDQAIDGIAKETEEIRAEIRKIRGEQFMKDRIIEVSYDNAR